MNFQSVVLADIVAGTHEPRRLFCKCLGPSLIRRGIELHLQRDPQDSRRPAMHLPLASLDQWR